MSREYLGKFFYELAKITFAAMIVGNAMAFSSVGQPNAFGTLIALGLLATYGFAYIGYRIIKS